MFVPRTLRNHSYTIFFAPRGRKRIFELGMQIAQQYLSPTDQLIGLIGEAGSGKSAIVKGMFPGLELTNDDGGVNVRPLPILDQEDEFGFFQPHTYHLDIRFESGFTSMRELADAILLAVRRGRRVVVEHFDLVYPLLGRNANLLVAVGEEIIVTRPTLRDSNPVELAEICRKTLPYRLMAHSAEDLVECFLSEEDMHHCIHGDIRHGFTLGFEGHKPGINIPMVERQIRHMIEQDIPISFEDDDHIMIGDIMHECTNPRMHVTSTGKIENFHLEPEFFYDEIDDCYYLTGHVGEKMESFMEYRHLFEKPQLQ